MVRLEDKDRVSGQGKGCGYHIEQVDSHVICLPADRLGLSWSLLFPPWCFWGLPSCLMKKQGRRTFLFETLQASQAMDAFFLVTRWEFSTERLLLLVLPLESLVSEDVRLGPGTPPAGARGRGRGGGGGWEWA